MSVVYVNGLLIQTVDNKVMATDAETGTPKWTYTEDVEKFVWQPVVSVSDNTVYVGAGNSQFGIIRIGHAWARSFVALDNRNTRSQKMIQQMFPNMKDI